MYIYIYMSSPPCPRSSKLKRARGAGFTKSGYIYIYICAYMYVYVCVCMYMYVFVCVYIYISLILLADPLPLVSLRQHGNGIDMESYIKRKRRLKECANQALSTLVLGLGPACFTPIFPTCFTPIFGGKGFESRGVCLWSGRLFCKHC